jgi:hypothetical protein
MAQHDRPARVELTAGLVDEARLGKRPIAKAPRPLAVAVAGPVEGDDAVAQARLAHQAAQHEVLHHAAQAVQQHERRAFAGLDVVQPHAIDSDEAPERTVLARFARDALSHYQRRAAHHQRRAAGQPQPRRHQRSSWRFCVGGSVAGWRACSFGSSGSGPRPLRGLGFWFGSMSPGGTGSAWEAGLS